jgi:hypothetical protein
MSDERGGFEKFGEPDSEWHQLKHINREHGVVSSEWDEMLVYVRCMRCKGWINLIEDKFHHCFGKYHPECWEEQKEFWNQRRV